MSAGAPPRPVFVIGSLRSGASLLALALGQHPQLALVAETTWFDRFAAALHAAYGDGIRRRDVAQLTAAGVELESFLAHFGVAADCLIRSSPRGDVASRWVDATPTNGYNVFGLLRLFPQARFIHVARDVGEVVASLTTPEHRALYRSRHLLLSEDEAYRHWLDAVEAALAAERAFGSAVVARVRRADLVEAPEATLHRCLAWLDEPFAPACLRPFSSIEPANPAPSQTAARASGVRLRAEALSRALLTEGEPNYPRDEFAVIRLEAAYAERWQRGELMTPSSLPSQLGPERQAAVGWRGRFDRLTSRASRHHS